MIFTHSTSRLPEPSVFILYLAFFPEFFEFFFRFSVSMIRRFAVPFKGFVIAALHSITITGNNYTGI
jgi:hypothetical protein